MALLLTLKGTSVSSLHSKQCNQVQAFDVPIIPGFLGKKEGPILIPGTLRKTLWAGQSVFPLGVQYVFRHGAASTTNDEAPRGGHDQCWGHFFRTLHFWLVVPHHGPRFLSGRF